MKITIEIEDTADGIRIRHKEEPELTSEDRKNPTAAMILGGYILSYFKTIKKGWEKE